MPKRISIGGLSATTTEASLQRMLEPFGTVVSVRLTEDDSAATSTADVRTFEQTQGATVTFEDDASGERAMQELNGALVEGNAIRVVAGSG